MRNKKKLKILDVFSFLLGFQMSMVIYIMSSFLKSISNLEGIEFFYLISYVISLVAVVNIYRLVKKIGRAATFKFLLIIKFLVVAMVLVSDFNWLSILGAIGYLAIGPLVWAALDILVENYTVNHRTGAVRGKFLTLMNLGILISPFCSAYLIEKTSSYLTSFVITDLIILVVIVISFLIFPREAEKKLKRRKISFSQTLNKIFSNGKLSKIYYIAFLLDFFYATMVVYMPLYLLELGMEWLEIGKIFTFMLLPFVIIQYPLGKMADKFTGEKEWLMVGIFLMGIFAFMAGFINHNHFFLWAMILFFGRVGAAIVEIMKDSYFYKQIGPEEVEVIDFFHTTRSGAYIIAMIIFGGLLIFLPLESVFIILGLIVLSGLYPLFSLKDTK